MEHFKIVFDVAFLIGAVAFIIGLKNLSSPETARKGNNIAMFGMIVAIIAALFTPLKEGDDNYIWIIHALAIGGFIGNITAKKVEMTSMPQLVSIFNGLGGATAMLLGIVEFVKMLANNNIALNDGSITLFALMVGGVSFTGSILAYLKLEGKVDDKKITLSGHSYFNIFLLVILLSVGTTTLLFNTETAFRLLIVFSLLSLIYGFSFVAPIGGADMPVVISLLNSFTGISAASAGFVYGNILMIVGGILVGASGTILTIMMCNAMNRSLWNVLLGGFTASDEVATDDNQNKTIKEINISDAAVQLFYSGTVMIVPGYGLAVAQAQKMCKELEDLLENNGVEVKYGIHPVAGRMPGHMNVLLAEANVNYDKLLDLDDANDYLVKTDVVIIVGANDVVNPAAERDPSSSIYGMPVLKVWNAKNVIVIKRSMSKGYAGIENPLFYDFKTKMLFGDAKKVLQNLVSELKEM